MNNDHFFWFPLQSYSYKNTVGAVACLFFSDPPLTPYATLVGRAGLVGTLGLMGFVGLVGLFGLVGLVGFVPKLRNIRYGVCESE